MAKWLGLVVVVLAGVLARPSIVPHTVQASEARTVDLLVQTPAGHLVQMQFLIRAESDADARATALAALPALNPDGQVIDPSRSEATAAFAPWGWKWAEADLPVPVSYNPDGEAANAEPAVRSALAAWSAVEGSGFRFRYAGATAAVPGTQDSDYDGRNIIGWLDLGCDAGCVLGVTSKVDDVREVDIVLNSNPGANLGDGSGGTVDTETTLLHEAGHMAGLEHSCQPFFDVCSADEQTAVMFPRYLGKHRTLGPDDREGIRALYPSSAPVRAPNPGLPVEQAGHEFSVLAGPGWTLTVLPAGSIEDAMRSLTCVQAVYAKNAEGQWQMWVRGAAAPLQSLTASEAGKAYWLYSASSCSASFRAQAQ
jgi:Matrixin